MVHDEKNEECMRGDIFQADLGTNGEGCEQAGVRPVLILQNNKGNAHSNTTIIAPLSSKKKTNQPTHCFVAKGNGTGLSLNSYILLEQIRVISKQRLKEKLGNLSEDDMKKVNKAIAISLGITIA